MKNNELVMRVIKEVAKELNLPEYKVYNSVKHFFEWQRKAFLEVKYSSFLWNYFGSFTVLDKKYEKWKEKQINNKQLTNKENNGKEKCSKEDKN